MIMPHSLAQRLHLAVLFTPRRKYIHNTTSPWTMISCFFLPFSSWKPNTSMDSFMCTYGVLHIYFVVKVPIYDCGWPARFIIRRKNRHHYHPCSVSHAICYSGSPLIAAKHSPLGGPAVCVLWVPLQKTLASLNCIQFVGSMMKVNKTIFLSCSEVFFPRLKPLHIPRAPKPLHIPRQYIH